MPESSVMMIVRGLPRLNFFGMGTERRDLGQNKSSKQVVARINRVLAQTTANLLNWS